MCPLRGQRGVPGPGLVVRGLPSSPSPSPPMLEQPPLACAGRERRSQPCEASDASLEQPSLDIDVTTLV